MFLFCEEVLLGKEKPAEVLYPPRNRARMNKNPFPVIYLAVSCDRTSTKGSTKGCLRRCIVT